jgi:hypothetical protein
MLNHVWLSVLCVLDVALLKPPERNILDHCLRRVCNFLHFAILFIAIVLKAKPCECAHLLSNIYCRMLQQYLLCLSVYVEASLVLKPSGR